MITFLIIVVAVCGFQVQTTFSENTVQSRGFLRDVLSDIINKVNEDTDTTTAEPLGGFFDMFGGLGETESPSTTTTTTLEPTTTKSKWGNWLGFLGGKSRRRRPISFVTKEKGKLLANDEVQVIYTTGTLKPVPVAPINKTESAHYEVQPAIHFVNAKSMATSIQNNDHNTPSTLNDLEVKATAEPQFLAAEIASTTESASDEVQDVPTAEVKNADSMTANIQQNDENTPSTPEELQVKASTVLKKLSADTATEGESPYDKVHSPEYVKITNISVSEAPKVKLVNNEIQQRGLLTDTLESLIEVLNKSITTVKPNTQKNQEIEVFNNFAKMDSKKVTYGDSTKLSTTTISTTNVECSDGMMTKFLKQSVSIVPNIFNSLMYGTTTQSANQCD